MFLVFCLIFAFLFCKERKRKAWSSAGWEGRKDLGGVVGQ